MEKKFSEIKSVAVHDGVFHADDILCVALIDVIAKKNENLELVIRSRDNDLIEKADIACDIGFGEFDHHQEVKQFYENGIMYAACGKIARALAADPEITDFGQEELEMLLIKALYSVQAFDNGQDGVPSYSNPFSFVGTFNTLNSNGGVYGPAQDEAFNKCLDMAEIVLTNILGQIKEEISDRHTIEDAIANKKNRIAVFSKYCRGWQNMLVDYNDSHFDDEIVVVVFPGRGTQWNIQVVPKTKDPYNHEAWASVPEMVKHIPGFVFRHIGAFMAVFETKEAALEAANVTNSWGSVTVR